MHITNKKLQALRDDELKTERSEKSECSVFLSFLTSGAGEA